MTKRILELALIVAGLLTTALAGAATDWSTQDYDLYPGDFNGDGKTDLLYVAKDPAKTSGIALSDGSGPNVPSQSWPSNYLGITWHSNLYSAIVADFNGDGRSDVFMQKSTPGDHYLLHADANGKITAITQGIGNVAVGMTWSAADHKLHAGDFSADGKADLFFQATSPAGSNGVLVTDSAGTFQSSATPTTWTDATWASFKWSTKNSNIFVGNFDGIGGADLLIQAKPTFITIDYEVPFPVPTYAPNAFGMVISQAGPTPLGASGVRQWNRNQIAAGVLGTSGLDWSSLSANVVVGDFDNDGRSDVLLQARRSGRSSYLISGSASGSGFASSTALSSSVTWAGDSYRLIAGNFDGAYGTGVYFQATSPSGNNYYSNSATSVSLIAHPSATGPAAPSAIGRTAGAASVAQSGDARYSLPIWTPPGTNGMQPTIRLEYASSGGNGWMGMGWAVSAVSSISRCANRWMQDNSVLSDGMFSATGKFCLDGNRLRLASGTYGTAGSIYRTEIESYRQIKIVNVDANGPTAFEVRTPDGRTMQYGYTADSVMRLAEPNGGGLSPLRMSWMLNRIKDADGNYMDFQYSQDPTSGGFYLQEIRWTGKETAPIASAAYKAVFVNEAADRNDPIWQGAEGKYIRMLRRLQRVDIYAISGNHLLRRYELTYAPPVSGQRSRLQSIQECGVGGTACYAPTTFDWWLPGSSSVANTVALTLPSIGVQPIVMDINGDTRDDLVWPSGNQPSGVWMYALATGGGNFGPPQSTNKSYNGAIPSATDWNGDGKQDLAILSGSTTKILLGSANGFSGEVDTGLFGAAFADINGDGKRDAVYGQGVQLQSRLRSGSGLATAVGHNVGASVQAVLGSASGKTRQDFDGDGYEDLLFKVATPYVTSLGVALGSGARVRGGAGLVGNYLFSGAGDFNGDGRTDILLSLPEESSSLIGLFSGIGQLIGIPTTGPICVLDWDADGKDDLLMRSGDGNLSRWNFHRSKGDGVFEAVSELTEIMGRPVAMCGDFDGDGLDDVAATSGGAMLQVLRHDLHNALTRQVTQEQMHSVTDGFGVTTRFTYGLLSDPALHTPIASPQEPSIQVNQARSVVRKVTAPDGSGSETTFDVTYTYEGALEDFSRGFLGFSKRTIRDTRSPKLRVEETYKQDFPYIGALAERLLKLDGAVVSRVANTWDKIDYGTGNDLRSRPYLKTQLTEQFEGATKFASTTSTATTVDSVSGLVTDRTTTTTEVATGLHTGATYTQRTLLTNLVNDTASWCLGRASDVTQTFSHTASASGGAKTRARSYDWNTTNCRLNWSKDFPSDPKWEVKTSYDYDAYGNVKEVTQTPATGQGQSPRTTKVDWTYYTGRFPRTITNAKNQVTTLGWDTTRGVRTSLTDANNVLLETVEFDALMRVKHVLDDVGAKSEIEYEWCNLACRLFDPNRRVKVTTINRDSGGGETSRTYHHVDKFDREILTQAQVLSGAYSSVRRGFDTFGRLWQESTPYLPGDPVAYTTYAYDDLGRLSTISSPTSESDASTSTVTRTYSGLTVSSEDAKNHDTELTLDPLGRVAQSKDHLGKSIAYDYDALGQLVKTADSAIHPTTSVHNTTTIDYYPNGLKRDLYDPDTGHTEYDYYPLGELKSQKDAKGTTVEFQYDVLSRLTTRTEPEGATSLEYDTATKGVGRLASLTSPGGYAETYAYDNTSGRLVGTTVTAGTGGASYTFNQTYDTAGRLSTLTYPQSVSGNRFAVRYNYGYDLVQSITDSTSGSTATTLWQANGMNARGQITDEQVATSPSVQRTLSNYDRIAGWLNTRGVGVGGGSQLQSFSYQYEKNGNLKQRRELNLGLTEDFTYDDLDRLTNVTLNSTATMGVAYDTAGIGNIVSKTGISGTYSYPLPGEARPHAVTSAGGASYTYDNNGNMATRAGAAIENFTYNLPKKINQAGGIYSEFSYGADRQRYKQVGKYPGGTSGITETTISIGGLFDVFTRAVSGGATTTEYRHTVVGPEGPVMVRKRRASGTTQEDLFLSKDHLGSVTLVTNSSAAMVLRLSYDAFGARRNGATWTGAPTAGDIDLIGTITRRGYTGHEHLDNLGLIHMNGRVQDPKLGRFLSADPIVQSPDDQQSFNRYSYVFNNPLKYTDPSGFQSCDLRPPLIMPFVFPPYLAPDEMSAHAPPTRADVGLMMHFYQAMNCEPDMEVNHGSGGSGGGGAYRDATVSTGGGASLADFLLNSGEHVSETFGDNSWSLAFWNVFVAGPVDVVRSTSQGDYSGAAFAAATTLFKPARLLKGPLHHLATNKNWISTVRGGPWSPRFEAMFKKAGMTLDDAANKVHIPGHAGPHPEAYHRVIFQRLTTATDGLSGNAYRDALRAELEAIRKDALTVGSPLNRLLTE